MMQQLHPVYQLDTNFFIYLNVYYYAEKMLCTIDDLHKVFSETYEARSKWPNVLLALGVNHTTINDIRVKFQNDSSDCYREGLSHWLTSGERSWEDVVKALSCPTVEMDPLAKKIRSQASLVGARHIVIFRPINCICLRLTNFFHWKLLFKIQTVL